ncbi:DEAD/DEAH box helicase family protein [candidate division KSB1 bacterium]
MQHKEAQARIKINKLLENAGWRFFDDQNGKANISLENNVKISKTEFDEYGNDFEGTANGFIDFLLLDDKGFPLIVLEAKQEDKDPRDGKEQARKYAQGLNVRFVILSNGNLHYFWDLKKGNPQIITVFPSPDSISNHTAFQPNPKNLINEIINNDYVVLTQKPDYATDPRYIDDSLRSSFITENNLKFLRDYQKDAVTSIQQAVNEGNDRFLFEMATGTGKTLIAAAVIKLYLRTGNARRVLFLVDRLELEDQAWKSLVHYLKNDYQTVIYKENKGDWNKAEIVVTTVQSLLFDNKYRRLFSPVDFDLVISDEAHRSIGGNARAVFEYFVGSKLGLTATPKDYLKKIDPDKINRRDPRELERRLLLDTYKTFGCERGVPTFRYSLVDAVKDDFLVNPVVIDARTEITTQLLSDQGYAVLVQDEEGDEVEKFFYQRDFERKFYSEETNKIFCKTFLENALKDPITGEIGKSIVFCVSQDHASKITQILNEFADKIYPEKYNSDFAVQVTSRITEAQQMTINFTNNNLNGKTKFKAGYKSSKTRVCVTVGMMTTGYDCPDLLNLCLMRPIFSPTDFIQIKGRGTRKNEFILKERDNLGNVEEVIKAKDKFKLFDFFANCEYFEEKFNYDEVLKLPVLSSVSIGTDSLPVINIDYENIKPDPLLTVNESEVGLEGMRIDRMFFDRFEDTVKKDDFIIEKVEQGDYEAAEHYIRNEIFDKPEDYINIEKLRKSVQIDRRLTLREIIQKIFGYILHFKSKDELLEEEFQKFISIHKPESDNVLPIKNFLKAYITDASVRNIVESKEYANFATHPVKEDFKALSPDWRKIIPEYVKDYISLNTYIS